MKTAKIDNQRKKILNNFIINTLLLLAGILVIISGLSLQIGYHMGGHEKHDRDNFTAQDHTKNTGYENQVSYEQTRGIDTAKRVLALDYHDWSALHKYTIISFSLFMIFHITVHWKWYKAILSKKLLGKNKQMTILTALFLLVSLTGLIPWFIDLAGSTAEMQLLLIELHDKLALLFIIFIVLHLTKRTGWYTLALKKLYQ